MHHLDIFRSNKSIVSRIDYSNDTATASPKGPLSANRQKHGSNGSSSFGYFGGGIPSNSFVDRIDYSNDTATASPVGDLSLAKRSVSRISSRENGMPLKGPGILEVPVSFGAFSRLVSQGGDFGYIWWWSFIRINIS